VAKRKTLKGESKSSKVVGGKANNKKGMHSNNSTAVPPTGKAGGGGASSKKSKQHLSDRPSIMNTTTIIPTTVVSVAPSRSPKLVDIPVSTPPQPMMDDDSPTTTAPSGRSLAPSRRPPKQADFPVTSPPPTNNNNNDATTTPTSVSSAAPSTKPLPPSASPSIDYQCDLLLPSPFGNFNQEDCNAGESVYDIVKSMPDLAVTVAFYELLDMTNLLRCAIGLTFLLPTNDAWSQIDTDMIGELLSVRNTLRDLFTYHILPELAFSAGLSVDNSFRATLLSQQSVLVSTNPLLFDNALVTVADQTGCAGKQLFHIVDEVLMPNLRKFF
jgi:uncharacterized surface protein with fasciclin (FAS1) repeats